MRVSFGLTGTAEEETWLRQQLAYIYVFGDREYAKNELPNDLDPDDSEWEGFRALKGLEDRDPNCLDIDYDFNDAESELWIYAAESGNPDLAVHMVQRFLKQFRPNECWSLTYSWTCSKLRVGEFGGGGVFVTADEIKWDDAAGFVEKQRHAFIANRQKERS